MSYKITAGITNNRIHYTFTTWIYCTSTHVRSDLYSCCHFRFAPLNYLIRSCLIVWWFIYRDYRIFSKMNLASAHFECGMCRFLWLLNSTTINKMWNQMIEIIGIRFGIKVKIFHWKPIFFVVVEQTQNYHPVSPISLDQCEKEIAWISIALSMNLIFNLAL